jgi:hypothetical protein
MSGWVRNWFYCKVPSEQKADVRGKGNYPLRSVLNQLEYLTDAPFECGPNDANVVAFGEAAVIIGGHDAVEEFLMCDIWPLCENYEFEVEGLELPISKVVMPMPKVTPIIVKHESEAALEAWIVMVANQLVGNYCMMEHNSCTGLQHGRLNCVFELASVHYQPRLEPIACATKR